MPPTRPTAGRVVLFLQFFSGTCKQQEAQRIAQAVTVKMRIPMLILILLPFMVLLLGPALMQVGRLLF